MPPRRTRRSCSRSTGSSSWSPRSRPPPSRSFSSASSPAARSAAPRPRATRRARDDGCRSAGHLPRPFDAGGRRGGAPGPDADGARAGDPDRARPERRRQDLVPAHRGRARRAVGGGEARARELLGRVGLEAKSSSLPGRLSGGEQQRVALCAALAHRPRLLLADEPTGELDEDSARLVYSAIAELAAAEGCTVVIVSHDPASTSIADRFVHIRDGRVSEETIRGEADESLIVVGRGGWLRLPQEFLDRAGIGARAAASLEEDRIVVTAAGPDGATPREPPAPG